MSSVSEIAVKKKSLEARNGSPERPRMVASRRRTVEKIVGVLTWTILFF